MPIYIEGSRYCKALLESASLEEQRLEASQVLSSKIDRITVNKIMDVVSQFTGYQSVLWRGEDDELSNNEYTV